MPIENACTSRYVSIELTYICILVSFNHKLRSKIEQNMKKKHFPVTKCLFSTFRAAIAERSRCLPSAHERAHESVSAGTLATDINIATQCTGKVYCKQHFFKHFSLKRKGFLRILFNLITTPHFSILREI